MRVITLDINNMVVGVKNVGENYTLQPNEFISDLGEIEQIKQTDGSFITIAPELETPQPTLEDKINYLYYKQMGVI